MKACSSPPTILLTGCVGTPEGIASCEKLRQRPVPAGEIARRTIPKKGLTTRPATYSMRDGIKVINRGYKTEKRNEPVRRQGLCRDARHGYLKVSFGPFYGSHVVFDLTRPTRVPW
jgi:hypothetical protein